MIKAPSAVCLRCPQRQMMLQMCCHLEDMPLEYIVKASVLRSPANVFSFLYLLTLRIQGIMKAVKLLCAKFRREIKEEGE